MARQRFSRCLLAMMLLAVGHGAAITSKGGGFQALEPDGGTSDKVDQQTNGQWQQQVHGQEQWPGQHTQDPAQWPGQQTQESAQWPGQQAQGPAQWPGQQTQGPAQWPGQQTQGPAQWPGQQTQGPAQWPGQQTQGPPQWPGQQTQGPAQWPGQQTQGPAQWPGQQTQGPAQWPGQQTQGPAQWPGQQTQGPAQWPEQPTQGPAQWPEQPTQGPAQWPEQPTQGPAQWPEQTQRPAQWPEQTQGPAQWPGQQTQGPAQLTESPAQWPGQQTQSSAQQTQGPVEWPEQASGQQGTGEWSNLEQMQGHEQEQEQSSQIVSERPVQEEKGGQIEHQKWEVPSKGVTQTEYLDQTSWTWDTANGNQRPGGDAKHPVVLPPVSTQDPSDLERVLTDQQLVWPVTVLVDTDPESLQHTQKQWMAVDEGTLQDNQFDLITFNDTRTSPARRVQGVAGLRRALVALGGSSASARGAAFLAVLTASQSAPPRRSAMLLFTGRPSADESYGALASQELVNRGCRLFVWWSGTRRYGSSSGAERLYRDAVQHTGGTFYDADQRPRPTPYEQHMQVILAAREALHGSIRTDVLVDSTVEELTIIIVGYVSKASLRPPSGDVIDLLLLHGGATAVAAGDGDTAAGGVLERRLNTRGERPGRWQLSTDDGSGSTGTGAANPDDGYDVIVKGTSGLRVGLQRPGRPDADGTALGNNDDLIVTIHGGPRTNITGLVLLDNKGNELRKTFYKQRTRRDEHNREVIELSLSQKALELEKQLMPHYVQVNGYNGYNGGAGEAFTRITPQIPTTGSLIVTLNAASNLTIQPGTQSQIFLDITNNGSRPSRISVQGGSSRNILYRVTPTNFQLNPNQKRSVSLHLYAPQNLVGVGDTLKIQVFGDLTVSEVFLEINIADIIYETRDTDRPSLKHKILNDCREIKSCSSRQWTMEATVQDLDSGIREISSMPQGVIWTPMVIGTKLPTTLKYKASCCDESVVITVIDLQNNVARYTLNVNEESSGLSPGVIAGIVVGALVILIIITVIIVVVCKKSRTTHTFQTQQVAR